MLPIFRAEKLYQRWISTSLPSGQTHQTFTPRIHHPNFALDFCSIFQSIALCLLTDCYAIFHLCHNRNAGKKIKIQACTRMQAKNRNEIRHLFLFWGRVQVIFNEIDAKLTQEVTTYCLFDCTFIMNESFSHSVGWASNFLITLFSLSSLFGLIDKNLNQSHAESPFNWQNMIYSL